MGGTARHRERVHRGKGCAGECKQELAGLRREVRVLKCEARYYRAMHGKAVARERRLKETLSGVRTKLKELRQQLRERRARRNNKSEQRAKSGSGGAAAAAPRPRGQQPGSSGHGRRDHSALPAQVEHHKLEPSARCCPKCGGEYGAAGSEDSEVLEIAVRAHRRVIKRQRYHCSCGCAGAPRVVTAPAPSRLIPKGILGVSIWVQVLLDKYRHHRPTYRLLEDLSTHGLELAQGTITDGLKRLAPLFAPLREALIGRNRLDDHWHADETGWYVFEATDEEAGQRWCLWVFWCREAVVFTLDRTRSARVPKEHFAGVAGGIVSVDRYSAYKRLAKDTPLELQYCWAHVRRDFIRGGREMGRAPGMGRAVAGAVNLVRRASMQRRGAHFVVELKPLCNHSLRLEAVLQLAQVHRLVLQRAPQPFDEHVVQTAPTAIHRAPYPAASSIPRHW